MKLLTRDIQAFQEKDFFLAIRDKVNFAWLIVHAARLFLLNLDTSGVQCESSCKLIIEKMSRLFFYKENKFFSVAFPFNVISENNSVIEITTYSGKPVDNRVISSVISILSNENFKLNPSPIDFWVDTDTQDSPGLSLLEEIFLMEPSYIRYDNDPQNENGKLHPLNHLDINYSSYSTYKLGLNSVIVDRFFENIVNISTDCSFLT